MSASDTRAAPVPSAVLPGQDPHHKSTILPPLTSQYPQWSRAGKLEMTRYPPHLPSGDGFSLENAGELGKKGKHPTLISKSEEIVKPSVNPKQRVVQLEQNIRFLQEQHKQMLASLHKEIEDLSQKNKELQYQLIIGNGGSSAAMSLLQSIPPSPDDDTKPKTSGVTFLSSKKSYQAMMLPKINIVEQIDFKQRPDEAPSSFANSKDIVLSPKQINVTPLQVEILEKELVELRASLHEAKSKNVYLDKVIQDQKEKLEKCQCCEARSDSDSPPDSPPQTSDAQNQTTSRDSDAVSGKLQEANRLIHHLRRENDDQKRELINIKANLNKALSNNSRQLGNNSRGLMGPRLPPPDGGGQHRNQQRFPPLHNNYWQHGPHRGGMEYGAHRNCKGGHHVEKEQAMGSHLAPTLPVLRNTNYAYGRRNYNSMRNNNHYHRDRENRNKDEGERKYRGHGRDKDSTQ